MRQTPAARSAQSKLAAASRDHGPDSPQAYATRRNYRTARLASQILDVKNDVNGFTATESRALVEAIFDDAITITVDPNLMPEATK